MKIKTFMSKIIYKTYIFELLIRVKALNKRQRDCQTLYWKIALRPNLTKLLRAIPSEKLHNFYNYHLHVSLTGDCQNAKILKSLRSKFSKTYYCRSMKLCTHVYT